MSKHLGAIALVLTVCLGIYILIFQVDWGSGDDTDAKTDKFAMLSNAKDATVMIINVPNTRRPQYYSGGSGAIISADGEIVTNHHVTDGAQELYVVLNDHSIHEAKLVGDFEDADLALLKIDIDKELPFFEFNKEPLTAGQSVYAIGSPFSLEQSITAGVLSYLKRYNPAFPMTYYLQSNIACNPGNSGGPLIDKQGKLIGINSWIKATSVPGGDIAPNPSLCFSVPDRVVEFVVNEIKAGNKLGEKWLGANYKNVDYITSLETGFNKVVGVQVRFIHADGPAKEAGLEKGDIIIDYNDEEINSVSELNAEVNLVPKGEPIKAIIWRQNETMEIQIASDLMFPEDEDEQASEEGEQQATEDEAQQEGAADDQAQADEGEGDDEEADANADEDDAADEDDDDDTLEEEQDQAA